MPGGIAQQLVSPMAVIRFSTAARGLTGGPFCSYTAFIHQSSTKSAVRNAYLGRVVRPPRESCLAKLRGKIDIIGARFLLKQQDLTLFTNPASRPGSPFIPLQRPLYNVSNLENSIKPISGIHAVTSQFYLRCVFPHADYQCDHAVSSVSKIWSHASVIVSMDGSFSSRICFVSGSHVNPSRPTTKCL